MCNFCCTFASFLQTMKRNAAIFIGLGVLLALFFCLDICSGSIWLWPFDTLSVMEHNILHAIRIPKAITAVLAGAALSVSGLIMQTLFRNPLAGPYTLGVSSGASLGVAFLTMCSATMVMMLVGMMFGSIAGALVSLLQNFANPDALKLFIVWTLGSLSSVSWADMRLLLPILLLGMLFVILAMKPLNGLLLGEDYARGLGINVQRTRLYIVLATGLLAGGVTAFCGPIAFIGVAVPHIARGIFQTSNHRITIPACALIGAGLLLICDVLCSLFVYPLPISTISALFGAPIIIWIILKNK